MNMFLSIVSIFCFYGCTSNSTSSTIAASQAEFQDSKSIDENNYRITGFEGTVAKSLLVNPKSKVVSDPDAAEGKKSLVCDLDEWEAKIGILSGKSTWDFTEYDRLLIDYKRKGAPCNLTFRIWDDKARNYTSWYSQIDRGEGTVEIAIAGIASNLDIKNLKSFYLYCENGVGEIAIDNIRLTKGFKDKTVEPTPASKVQIGKPSDGNLIANGSFEWGLTRWDSWGKWDGGDYEFGSVNRSQDKQMDIPNGDVALEIACKKPGRGGIFTQPMNLKAGDYSLSVHVKSHKSVGKFRIAIVGSGVSSIRPLPDFTDKKIDTEWKRIEKTIRVRGAANNVRLYLFNVGETSLHIDDVRLIPAAGRLGSTANEFPLKGTPTDFKIVGRFLTKNGEPFFPIGIYSAPAEALADTGFNLVVTRDSRVLDRTTLDAYSRNGLYVSPNFTGVARSRLPFRFGDAASAYSRHPAIFGWYMCDEPDHVAWTVPPQEIREATASIRAKKISQPTWTCVMSWADSNFYQYANSVDILGSDVYPIMDRKEPLTMISDKVDLMRKAVNDSKPVFLIAQSTGKERPEELTAMTYLALTHGVSGVIYWEYYRASSKPDPWAATVRLSREMKALGPILTAPETKRSIECDKPEIHYSAREMLGRIYIIAVNSQDKPIEKVTFQTKIPGLKSNARVVFESRESEIDNGRFVESFNPYERHVFELLTADAKK